MFVLWQYKTDHRQFLPRLGAHITHITVSSDDSLIAVCQKDNGECCVVEMFVSHCCCCCYSSSYNLDLQFPGWSKCGYPVSTL